MVYNGPQVVDDALERQKSQLETEKKELESQIVQLQQSSMEATQRGIYKIYTYLKFLGKFFLSMKFPFD